MMPLESALTLTQTLVVAFTIITLLCIWAGEWVLAGAVCVVALFSLLLA